MARSYSKNVTFNAIVEVNAAGPIDNRTVVATKSDLIASSTFGDFKYDGMPVVTRDDGKLYILANAAQSTASDYSAWIEMASDSSAKAGSSVVVNGNGISVVESIDPTDGHKIYTVSAVVPSTDKILTVGASGIQSGLSFSYNSDDRKIYLYGSTEDAAHKIGEVDCSSFIKDGMLWGQKAFVASATSETITITKGGHTESHEFTNLVVGHQYLAFCFTNGEVPTATYSWEITDLQDLVDIYTAGNGLQFNSEDDHKFEVKLDGTTLVVSAAGLKVNEEVYKVKDVDETAVAGVSVVLDGSDVKASVTPGSVAENNASVVLGGAVWAADREVENTLIGTTEDQSSDNTIHAAKKYADEVVNTAIDALDATVSNTAGSLVEITVSEENGVLTSISSTETALQAALDAKQDNITDGSYVEIANDTVDIKSSQIASEILNESSVKLATEGAVKEYADALIAGEVQEREEDEEVIAAAINDLQDQINEASSDLSELESTLTQEIEDRTAGDIALGEALDAEEEARKAADGDLSTLTTDAKNNLVAAINEIDANADAAMAEASVKVADVKLDGTSIVNSNHEAVFATVHSDYDATNNKLLTANDIKDLSGAMHFIGVVATSGSVSIVDAIKAKYAEKTITNAKAGDTFVDSTTHKEWVVKADIAVASLDATSIEELGNVDPQTVVTSFAEKTGDITLESSAAQVQLSMSNYKVLSASVVADSITTTELAVDAVETENVKDSAITNAKLATVATEIASSSSTAIATEGIVKDYVDNSIADLDVEDAETVTISEGIVTVKTAIEADGIISAGSVSGSFENGAQVNVLEGVKVNNVELTIDSEKKVNVDLTSYATNERVDEVEETATEAIEDLDLRVDALEALYIVKSYTKTITDSTAVDVTIPNTEHHCGTYPIVQVYFNDELVNGDVKLINNSHSDVYVDWEDTLAPSAEHPIVIRIIG